MFAPQVIDQLRDVLAEASAPTWQEASCRDQTGVAAGLFFSDRIPDIARAKAICAGCPVVAPCLEGALARREPWGVWGGQLFADGVVLAHKRPRGRPPKHPRPAADGDVAMTA